MAAARRAGHHAYPGGFANGPDFGNATHLQIRYPNRSPLAAERCSAAPTAARPADDRGRRKALGINRFAMKRPFAAVIICMVRCTRIVEVRPLGWRPAALN